jgi:alpha-tubulin suppressor-like RCC1 family protein
MLCASSAFAVNPAEVSSKSLTNKAFVKPELQVSSMSEQLNNVSNMMSFESGTARQRFNDKYGGAFSFHIDPRSGTPTNIVGSIPLIPGNGRNNRITNNMLSAVSGRLVSVTDADAVAAVSKKFIQDNSDVLNIDVAQLGAVTATKVSEELWQINAVQSVNGIKVRKARLAATVSHGNLVMIGTAQWGNAQINTIPKITADDALKRGFQFVDGQTSADKILSQPVLEIIPAAPLNMQDGDRYIGAVGKGYNHKLVWTFVFTRSPDVASWEVIVDAQTGEILSLTDLNQYLTSGVTGGVYPLTNTEICNESSRCGTMQFEQPMPFVDTGQAAPNNYSNSAGLFDFVSGKVITKLHGKYVQIFDLCGPVSESTFGSEGLNLRGANGDHDCVSGGASAGNTPAARTAYYEINRMQEMARGYLPNNNWLKSTLTSNVNIDQTCNAYFDGMAGTVNFFKSGDGCRNTGEIAGVFDHEWAHGLDFYDGSGLSSPGESFADIAGMYRLQTSCMGYGFFATQDKGCGQTADGTGYNTNIARNGEPRCALNCSGVRETDWDQLTNPLHTPDTPQNFVCTSCPVSSTGYNGPCGRQAHCESAVDTESAWDFVARDLQSPPFSYDSNSAFLIASRIFFLSSSSIGDWHTCNCSNSTSGGCGATNAYMQWLAADDDDGDITNGTPHMTALYNAFNRHGIACELPAPVNSGCSGTPKIAPELNVVPDNNRAVLNWNEQPAAFGYKIFRTEGPTGCSTGKTLIANVTGALTYTDLNLANNRQYCYSVVATGSSDACFSSASSCTCVTPTVVSHGTLQGTVTRSGTGVPMQNVIIKTSGGHVTATDSNGFYKFDDMAVGTYEVSASALGYYQQTVTDLEVGNNSVVVTDFILETLPMVSLQGTVKDGVSHGWPLYATLRIVAPAFADNSQSGYGQLITTDPVTGKYSTEIYMNTAYTITVSSPGYIEMVRELNLSEADIAEDFIMAVNQESCAPGYGMLYDETFETGNGRYQKSQLFEGIETHEYPNMGDWQWGVPENGPYSAHSGSKVWGTNLTGPYAEGEDIYLTSPDIDLSQNAGKTSTISWWHWVDARYAGGSVISVDISNNSGASWTPKVWYRNGGKIVTTWTKEEISLSTSYSVSTFRIRFEFKSGLDPYEFNTYPGWFIDDIRVTSSGGCQAGQGGLLTGYITDSETGNGINNAEITNSKGQTTSSTANVDYRNPDNNGIYSLFLPIGSNKIEITVKGYYPKTIDVNIAANNVSLQNIVLTPLPKLAITTESLPFAVFGTNYTANVSVSGGLAPYQWTLYGVLPTGLSLNSKTGLISGIPENIGGAANSYVVSFYVTDADGNTVNKMFTMYAYRPLEIYTGNIAYKPGIAFHQVFEASGGKSPYTWSVIAGSLPNGISLDEATGIISGETAPVVGSSATIQVTDANFSTLSKEIVFIPALVVTVYSPADNQAVAVNSVIQANFSKSVDVATVTSDNFMVSRSGTVTAIAARDYFTVALKSDGSVTAWGNNDYGQLDIPSTLGTVTAIAAGSAHIVALQENGTVVVWGANDYGQTTVPEGLSNVIAIAAGNYHSLAVKNDGTVVAWGRNDQGQSSVPANLTDVTAVAAGVWHSVALKNDGSVVAWGYNGEGETTVPSGLGKVTAIASGEWHTLALKSDGTVAAWGFNNNNQTAVPTDLTDVVTIAAGNWHSLAVKSDGAVVGWGLNNNDQATAPAGQSGIVAVAGGVDHTVALKDDSTLVSWGDNSLGQTNIPIELSTAGNLISGSLLYNPELLTITFTPEAPLSDSLRYSTIISGITAEDGSPLASPVSWSFTTHNLFIDSNSLPSATINQPYSATLNASGGVEPYRWSLVSGTLPVGLTLNQGYGVISGTPTAVGTSAITLSVEDDNGLSIVKTFVITVNSDTLSITTESLPDGYRTVPYNSVLTASGGTAPYTWSIISSTLPSGLSFKTATGVISGTPTTATTKSVTFKVTDSKNAVFSKVIKISVYTKPLVSTLSLPFGTTGTSYNQTIAVANGKLPFLFTVTTGKLPSGLTLERTTGRIYGTPTVTGDYIFSVQAADANGLSALQSYSVSVYSQLQITDEILPFAIMAQPYSHTVTAAGGLPPYSWSASGSLPDGFTLNADTGELYGSSAASGTVAVTLVVTDANTVTATKTFQLIIEDYLHVIDKLPVTGSMVPVDVGIHAVFNSPVDPATLTTDNVSVYRSGNVKSISAGSQHVIALKTDGTVMGWGYNYYGQASVPGGMSNITAIAAGTTHSVALRNDGTLIAWGESVWDRTKLPDNISGITAITAGEYGNLAIKEDKTVVTWGASNVQAVPVGLTDVVAVSMGSQYSAALKSNGTVVVWGDNYFGQTDVPAGLTGVKAISAGSAHMVALKNDGTVVAWGWNDFDQLAIPEGLSSVTAISAAGALHTLALKKDGTVVAWGRNDHGQTDVPPGLTDVVAIAAGGTFSVALKRDGTVVAWGYNEYGQTTIPSSVTETGNKVDGVISYDETAHAVNFKPSLPLLGNTGYFVRVADVTSLNGVPMLAPYTWNFNTVFGLYISTTKLPYGTVDQVYNQQLAVSGGVAPYTLSILSGTLPSGILFDETNGQFSGTPKSVGNSILLLKVVDASGASQVKSLTLSVLAPLEIKTQVLPDAVQSISYSQAIQVEGGLQPYVWNVDSGTLPTGFYLNSATGEISGVIGYTGIFEFTLKVTDALNASATKAFSISVEVPLTVTGYLPLNGATVSTGTTVQATFSDQLNPETITAANFIVAPLVPIKAVSVGGYHNMILKADGTVIAWGNNEYNQTTVPENLGVVTAMAAGGYHSLALLVDGTVRAWGSNDSGVTAVPQELNGVTAIAAGATHSLALKDNGTVMAWGADDYGQSAVPVGLTDVIAIAAGGYHSVALKRDGTVVAWGNNEDGEIDVPEDLTGVIAIAAGSFHTLALKNSGSVVAWGWDYYGQSSVPEGLTEITAIAAGETHSIVLKKDNTVQGWGNNEEGQISIPEQLADVAKISAGGYNSLAVKSDDNVIVWGDDNFGQTAIPASLNPAGNAIAGSLNYNPANMTITFTPATTLVNNGSYLVRISGIESNAGIPLAGSVQWNFTAKAAIAVSTATLPFGVVAVDYNSALMVTDGVGPYHWSVLSGLFPSGLSLDSLNGEIKGKPETSGDYVFILKVVDADGATASKEFTLAIYQPLAITTSLLMQTVTGADYSQSVSASGGKPGYTWSIISGNLPVGLSIGSTNGLITGSTAVAGSYTFTVQVADANMTLASRQFTLTVNFQPVRITGNVRYFDTLQTAYNDYARLNGDISIELLGGTLSGNINCDHDVPVLISGGFSQGYQQIDTITVISGTMTIRKGKVTVKNIALKPMK